MGLRWWLRFLTGFAVVYAVLAGLAGLDATARLGPAVLAGVLVTAVLVEQVLDGGGPAVVAAATTVPLAYLYETGRTTVWAPALVHTAIDSFKLVDVPAEAQPTSSLTLAAVALLVPLLALAVPRRVLADRRPTGASSATARPD
ncbi:hypothetical protein [Modestobacter marinus]|uniref:hypothetical protein n=1 Tax=Modestobacter marinus TaxID=477641 RepID=UPI001C96FC03|nr:hypothetical protein [Modestobacter marinus]